MYILIYKPEDSHRETTEILEGNFPSTYLESLLSKRCRLVVISLYSNTIKIPTEIYDSYGERKWNEFLFPISLLKSLK